MYTKFGRQKEAWECSVSDFCDRGGIANDSHTARSLWRLSDDEFAQVAAVCDPKEDSLTDVCSDYFSVNHGSVGSQGIEYSFRR